MKNSSNKSEAILTVHSRGLDLGSTFTLELPLNQKNSL